MHSVIGDPVVASLPVVGPPPVVTARIEVPVTRAIASFGVPAVLNDAGDQWVATLESPVAVGEYLICWQNLNGAAEVFVPLHVEAAA